ncbi:hypothetical protein AWENTII_008251 [Aspergillus wentii]
MTCQGSWEVQVRDNTPYRRTASKGVIEIQSTRIYVIMYWVLYRGHYEKKLEDKLPGTASEEVLCHRHLRLLNVISTKRPAALAGNFDHGLKHGYSISATAAMMNYDKRHRSH